MRKVLKVIFSTTLLSGIGSSVSAELVAVPKVPVAPNGIEMPLGYKHWQLVGSSHRMDKHSLRVILGNSIAMLAIQKKQTNPWPDGAILAKLVWKESIHPDWAEAIVPGDLEHVEFMLKDSQKYKNTGGWGYARWLGMEQKPYGTAANFANECMACHTAVKDKDFVFTLPVPLP